MADTIKYLQMQFVDETQRTRTIRIQNPKASITKEQILEVMNFIIAQDIFSYNMSALVTAKSAKIITTTTEEKLS